MLGGNCTETKKAKPFAAEAGEKLICTGVNDPMCAVSAADTSACIANTDSVKFMFMPMYCRECATVVNVREPRIDTLQRTGTAFVPRRQNSWGTASVNVLGYKLQGWLNTSN